MRPLKGWVCKHGKCDRFPGVSVHTDYRLLACENHRIFYLCEGDRVEVVRVLHTLQDYMRALFL